MTKVVITGSAGFIGSHLAERLLTLGYQILGIDDLNDYYSPEWKRQNLLKLKLKRHFKFVQLDIRKKRSLSKVIAEFAPDTIVHLAARAGVRPSLEKPLLYQDVNIKGTLNLLEIARAQHIPQFIFASSSSVYGNQSKVPFSETDECNYPISPYAATKKAAEMLCYTYAQLYGIKTTVLRFFTVYGPRGRPDMAPYLFTEAFFKGKPINQFGDGSSQRDYTYVDDIVSGIVAAVKTPFDFEIINLGNNKPVGLLDFLNTLRELTHHKPIIHHQPFQPGDVQITYADISKAKKLLHYQPSTSFQEGLAKFVKWYKKNRF